MSVFISYNSLDEAFVDKLGNALMAHNIPIWRDKWQLGLGDSITNSVQDALEKASFVCIVLSENSLRSKWVGREITASLVRELEESKLTILPLVIDDSKIPLFLRDRLYADFRKDFDTGVNMIVNAVKDKYNLFSGKMINDKKSTSFSTDIRKQSNSVVISLDIISEDDDADYFILTNIKFTGNSDVLKQYNIYESEGKANSFVKEIIKACGAAPDIANARIVIGGKEVKKVSFSISSSEGDINFTVDVSSKKVGPDNGKFVLFNFGALFLFYNEQNI